MKFNVEITNNDRKINIYNNADKVELLNIGDGVLSIIKDSINTCYPLKSLYKYVITNVKEKDIEEIIREETMKQQIFQNFPNDK